MISLNHLKNILKGYFNTHAQINSVYYCDDFDFSSERNIDYPVVNIEYLTSNISDKVMNHNFKIVIGDITLPDNTDMEDEVHSDSLEVAEDFFTFLQNYEGFSFNKSSSINKFTDDTLDRASGIVFTITLSVIRKQNRCDSPVKIKGDFIYDTTIVLNPTDEIHVYGDLIIKESTLTLSDNGTSQTQLFVHGDLILINGHLINDGVIKVYGNVYFFEDSDIVGEGTII